MVVMGKERADFSAVSALSLCDETQSSPLLTYFISGIRPFYNLAVKQTIARANIVRA